MVVLHPYKIIPRITPTWALIFFVLYRYRFYSFFSSPFLVAADGDDANELGYTHAPLWYLHLVLTGAHVFLAESHILWF